VRRGLALRGRGRHRYHGLCIYGVGMHGVSVDGVGVDDQGMDGVVVHCFKTLKR
jgi:hypothetical protein